MWWGGEYKQVSVVHETILPANISMLCQRSCYVDMMSRRRTTSNQRWNNVVYVNVEICNVVYFSLDINNVAQCQNNIVIFNVERDSWRWSKSKQRGEYEYDITIYEMLKRAKKYFWASKKKKKKKTENKKLKLNTLNFKFRPLFQNLVDFIPHFKRYIEKNICKAAKIFMTSRKCCITETIFKLFHFVKYWLTLTYRASSSMLWLRQF